LFCWRGEHSALPACAPSLLANGRRGCTREQVLEATGWKAVSMQQQAAAAGFKLKVDESKKPFVYRAGG
jgi:hypothetical protein